MPNLGQGGCQAFEDGFVLSNLLCSVTDKNQIPNILQDYYRKRILRSAVVQGLSRFSSDVIISAFTTPFQPGEFFKEGLSYKYLTVQSFMTFLLRAVLPAIFYGQFSFLYSFAPKSYTKEQITDLAKNTFNRNKNEAESVYKLLKEGYQTYFTAKTMQFMSYNKKTKEVSLISDASIIRKQAKGGK